jgi:hypothetical protein
MDRETGQSSPVIAVKSAEVTYSPVSSLDALPPKYYLHISYFSHHFHATCLNEIAVIVLGRGKAVPVLNHLVPKVNYNQSAL